MKRTIGAITMAAVGGMLLLAPTAVAKDGDVRVAGSCTKATSVEAEAQRGGRRDRGRVRGRPEQERRPLDGRALAERDAGRASHRRHARPERLVRGALRDAERAGCRPVRRPGHAAGLSAAPPRRRSRSAPSRNLAGSSRGGHRRDARRGGGRRRPPLLVLDRLEAFLDEHGLGAGPLRAERIGPGGGSNFSFLLERGDDRFVLRRPPRPPLPPSAHDMVREARLQLALAPQGIRLPPILAVCEDEDVLGVAVLRDGVPRRPRRDRRAAPRARGARRPAGGSARSSSTPSSRSTPPT